MNQRAKVLIFSFVGVMLLSCVGIGALTAGAGAVYLLTTNASASSISEAEAEQAVLQVASNFAASNDVEAARAELDAIGVPNIDQYVSFLLDRYIQEQRDDASTEQLFMLAEAIGAASPAMAVAMASPTPNLPPTATPTITPIPPTETPVPTETPEPTEVPTEVPTDVPTETPEPTATPIPPTVGPPTNTPEPTATPEPTRPAVDFVIAEQYLIPNPTYNVCPGAHQIYVTVVDAAGNPLDGVIVEDTFQAVPPKTSGEKGPGKLEYDLWNNGFSLQVIRKQDGSPASSEVTATLSSWDEDIPNEWLIEANYCLDMADCVARKSSNQLCRGHYSYNVTFQRTY